MYVHAYTLYGSIRPFGVSCLLGSYDKAEGPELFVIDPSGVSFVSANYNTFIDRICYSCSVVYQFITRLAEVVKDKSLIIIS